MCINVMFYNHDFIFTWNSRIKTHRVSVSRRIASKTGSIRKVMTQLVTCNVREHEDSIIKSSLKLKDWVFLV